MIAILLLLTVIWMIYRGSRSIRRASTARSTLASRSTVVETPGTPLFRVSVPSYGNLDLSSFSGRKSAAELRSEGDRCWAPKGTPATIAGYIVHDGMVYVGKKLTRQDGYSPDNCLIDPNLQVASKQSNTDGSGMSYYPSYLGLDPSSRRAYLEWLAGGKCEPTAYIGYVFLYFYGLERRLLLDGAIDEREGLIAEVERLRSVYANNGSFDGYSQRLLDAIRFTAPGRKFYLETPPLNERRSWEVPLLTRVAIGQLVVEGSSVPADWMLAWLIADPNTHLRTPATRAREEFVLLFRHRFGTKYPAGFKIDTPKRKLKSAYNAYRAASGTFRVDLSGSIGDLPDITSLTGPVTRMRKLAEECVEALDPYSRFLGRHPDSRGSFLAITLLPRELGEGVESDHVRKLRSMFDRVLRDGPKLFGAKELLAHITGSPAIQTGRAMLQSCADALAYFGAGVAPDPQTALQLPKANESIAVFKLPKQRTPVSRDSEAFRHALLFLSFAAYVAHADGMVTPAERKWMNNFVSTFPQLDETARVELNANLLWLLAVPPELGALRSRLAALSSEERQQIGRTALAVACTNGTIHTAEIKSLQRVYKILTLDEAQVLRDVHSFIAGASPANDPVPIRLGYQNAKGHAIPKPSRAKTATGVRLDAERIHQISENTKRVNAILAKVFQSDEPAGGLADAKAPTPASRPSDARESHPFDGLEQRQCAFLGELLTRREWPRQDVDTLARSFSLMTDGAIEAINEWAFERYGDAIIEDSEPMIVNRTLQEKVQQASDA